MNVVLESRWAYLLEWVRRRNPLGIAAAAFGYAVMAYGSYRQYGSLDYFFLLVTVTTVGVGAWAMLTQRRAVADRKAWLADGDVIAAWGYVDPVAMAKMLGINWPFPDPCIVFLITSDTGDLFVVVTDEHERIALNRKPTPAHWWTAWTTESGRLIGLEASHTDVHVDVWHCAGRLTPVLMASSLRI